MVLALRCSALRFQSLAAGERTTVVHTSELELDPAARHSLSLGEWMASACLPGAAHALSRHRRGTDFLDRNRERLIGFFHFNLLVDFSLESWGYCSPSICFFFISPGR